MKKNQKKKKYTLNIQKIIIILLILSMLGSGLLAIFAR